MESTRSYIEDGPALEGRRASKTELLKEYGISIEFLSIGCVISIGCKKIPFTNLDEAMKELTEYVKDPHKTREKWYKIFDQQ